MHQRAEEGERLLDWAFANFEDVTLFAAGDAVEHVPVWLGAAPTVPLVGGRDLVVTMPRGWRQTREGDGGLRCADARAGGEGHHARQADRGRAGRAGDGGAAAGRRGRAAARPAGSGDGGVSRYVTGS